MGRGSSGFGKADTGRGKSVFDDSNFTTIETVYNRRTGYYDDYVYEAVKGESFGEIIIQRAEGRFESSEYGSQKPVNVTYGIKAGISMDSLKIEGKDYGINWGNVKSVSGKTYDVQNVLREKGFEWDKKAKKWVKK